MNGAADMGGMHGFGPVQVEPNSRSFTPTGSGAFSRSIMPQAQVGRGPWTPFDRRARAFLPPNISR